MAIDWSRMETTEAAGRYLEKGFSPLPIRDGKNPGFPSWQNFRANEATLDQDFQRIANIGLLLGDPSGGLVDVDLDCPEARALAPSFLPTTLMVGGREHSSKSHYFYVAHGARTERFVDPSLQKERAMIVELRSTGSQTLVSPSIHPTGDHYRWDGELDPSKVACSSLRTSVARLATSVLVTRNWLEGNRHAMALALSALLLRAGWSAQETESFILHAAKLAGDDELEDRVQAVRDTAERLASGASVSGISALTAVLGERVVSTLLKWLGIPVLGLPNKINNSAAEGDQPPYSATEDGLFWYRRTKEGVLVPVRISNFTAGIVTDITEDDGADQRRFFEIEAIHRGKRERRTISVEDLIGSKWPVPLLGAGGVVFPRMGEHLRCALQLLSKDVEHRTVFTHTGWRELEDKWVYLHKDGAICAGCPTTANVRLEGVLSEYCLPMPPSQPQLSESYRSVLDLIAVNDEAIMIPIVGGVFCAVLTEVDFSIHLEGETGAGKTELVALAQSFFGAGFHSKNLPGSWASSANSLELMAYAAKDAVFVIDDFKPGGTSQDKARLHREADRIFRAQGNRAGRGRLSRDGILRMERPPRGLILSTGEDIPFGESLRARLVILEASREKMNWKMLSECQRLARAGTYASANAAFIQWLAPRFARLRSTAQTQLAEIRDSIAGSIRTHKRTPTTIAFLIRGWNLFLESALEQGCIDELELGCWTSRVLDVLLRLGLRQSDHQGSEEPTGRFLELLVAVLSGERAHLVAPDGGRPDDYLSLGWRLGNDGNAYPQGKKIGWLKDDLVFLLPDAAYAATHELSMSTGDPIALTPQTLWKRMNEKRLLAATDAAGGTLKIRRKLQGKEERVIAIRKALVIGSPKDHEE